MTWLERILLVISIGAVAFGLAAALIDVFFPCTLFACVHGDLPRTD